MPRSATGLTGAWLVGSAALGDFDLRRSDLDVASVLERARAALRRAQPNR